MATSLEQSQIKPARSVPRPPTPPANRGLIFLHALAFVFGFGIVFTLLGLTASFFGQQMREFAPVLQRLGAILLVIFALTTLGVFRWIAERIRRRTPTLPPIQPPPRLVSILEFFNNLLYTEKRVSEMHRVSPGWGIFSSMLLGVSFSAGWVPCIGPILSSILLIAGDSARVYRRRGSACHLQLRFGDSLSHCRCGLWHRHQRSAPPQSSYPYRQHHQRHLFALCRLSAVE